MRVSKDTVLHRGVLIEKYRLRDLSSALQSNRQRAKTPKFNCNDAISDAASWRLCSVRDSMCWKDYRGRVTKGTSLSIGLSAYNKMYFVELGEKKKPRLTWSVTAGYKYKVGKYWNGREVSFSAHTFYSSIGHKLCLYF